MKKILYATPQEEIPNIDGVEVGYYYVTDEEAEARGTDLDKTVRYAVEFLGEITDVGRQG